jgi:glycerol-3-phosphate dehydrogenase
LVVGRRLADAAIGLRSERSATEDPLGGGRRFLFLVPQEETTLVGTWYGTAEDGAVDAALEQGRLTLLEDVRRACPGLGLTPADIVGLHWGRLPLDPVADGRTAMLADRPQVAGPTDLGFANLHAVETVKYTTARGVAERVLDRVVGTLPGAVGPCRTAETPLAGAGIGAVR